ncbi:E3 ubiquitin-protein ligase UPL4 [Morus notabilis]|uniref:HECT-type E3 ubiquitin transferase n=1 Tax=Morus notabilis TaxID=981085 RepID=W9S7X8_9ROSA|nr:E3 ubiquitin-protein ligase UPL4 [Morus notabilis]
MGNRGQKRAETVEDLPADKRACNSMEFRPSSSAQAPLNSANSTAETDEPDMDTSSSASASSRSEGEPEKDSAYGSCDSDDAEHRHSEIRDYQRQRSSNDHGKFKRILSSLGEEREDSGHLALLTELCEVLSFCNEYSLSSMTVDSLSPHLVKLARHPTNPDIMLLAIRAMTYLCDVYPKSSGFLIRHDAVTVLCQKLMAIEDMDVAEQCLQALEKISREQPLACLQAGATMAVLTYIDFFSTIIQRVALSTVMNICKKLPSECHAPIMEAVPILCNLLQYEDRQLVENVAICLIRITERVSRSSEKLDELCKHGLIQQTFHLINSNSRTTLSLPVCNGLLGVLVKLSSGSIAAFRTLHELNISNLLKDILSTYDLSHGVSSPHTVDGQCNQVYEVLKLLDGLLPASITDHEAPQLLDKESFLASRPELLQNLGMDVLPFLIQVVNSGANLYICYGCLSVIKNLIHLSTSDMLFELLKNSNISSFLAGIFTRKDPHVLILALQIAELILQKLSDVFLKYFIKEGVLFAIDALLIQEKCPVLTPEKCSQLIVPISSGFSFDSSQKSSSREVLGCLCYAFASGTSASVSERNGCKLEKDSLYDLAKHIRNSYFSSELFESNKAITDVLQELRTFSMALSDLMEPSVNNNDLDQREEKAYGLLHQVIMKLNGKETVSTFEFIESGIVKSLVNYLSDGQYLRIQKECCAEHSNIGVIRKRFEVFARLFLSSSDPESQDLPISTLIQKLQNALSSLETFPVILSNAGKMRNSRATVPSIRCTPYPCLRVRFQRGDGETCLRDYCEDYLSVDSFSSMEALERFLWSKVKRKATKHNKTVTQAVGQSEKLPLQSPASTSSSQDGSPDGRGSDSMLTESTEMQEGEDVWSKSAAEQALFLSETSPQAIFHRSTDEELQFSPKADTSMKRDFPASCSSEEDASPKLSFFLEGQQLNRELTLYQAIMQKQIKEHAIVTTTKLWSQAYTLTYRKAVNQSDNLKECSCSVLKSVVSDRIEKYLLQTSNFSDIFASEVASDMEKSSPTHVILYLLKCLEKMNKFIFHLISEDRIGAFAEGKLDHLDNLKVAVLSVPQIEFVSSKLTEKLEQQMRDSMAVSVGGMPSWCNKLMASCPFLFSFEAKSKYFRLAAFGQWHRQSHEPSQSDSGIASDRRSSSGSTPRKKFLVFRNDILGSAAKIMELHACHKVPLEVEYNEEVGTGLGPTLEFYTLVSHEFQKAGLGLWREDHGSFTSNANLCPESTKFVTCTLGLFPRPWSSLTDTSNGIEFSEVSKKFVLLGQIVAKALQDGRVLDLHFSKEFYKLILGQKLGLFDILSFDPELGRTLLEFKALADRKLFLESTGREIPSFKVDSCFRDTRIEDLFLDFTLPGYPDFLLASGPDYEMVTMRNLEDYISLIVDATVSAGISRQVEAFKSGFNQVFPIERLQIFTEEELERLLCGEHDSWPVDELVDHVKFDHGYTASSPPVVNLLEIIQEFDNKERRAFLQFVTGAPRLPPGGLASLNPKLTIVRKFVYTSSDHLTVLRMETMKEKLLYAITEGQGSFHLS